MSGRERNDEKGNEEGEGGGWGSTFWKVAAGAAAATVVAAGGIYSVMKQLEAAQVAAGSGGHGGEPSGLGAGGSGGKARALGAGGGGEHHTGEEKVAVWTKPKRGWVKLNVDGSLRPRPRPESNSAGCGGVLRDASGNWMYGFAQKLSPALTVDETEKQAILIGLQWAKGKGVTGNLEVESDNEGVVNTVNSEYGDKDTLICKIRELLRSPDWEATLTWINGRANQVADKLADNAHDLLLIGLKDGLKEYGPHDIPYNCRHALSKDAR